MVVPPVAVCHLMPLICHLAASWQRVVGRNSLPVYGRRSHILSHLAVKFFPLICGVRVADAYIQLGTAMLTCETFGACTIDTSSAEHPKDKPVAHLDDSSAILHLCQCTACALLGR